MIFEFFVPIVPVGKARPIVCRNGHTFTPAKTRNAEQEIRAYFLDKYPNIKAFTGAVELSTILYIPRPKSRALDVHCLQKPDIDNSAKLICDALNGYAYADDKQIVTLNVQKKFADGNFGIHIRVIERLALVWNKRSKKQ